MLGGLDPKKMQAMMRQMGIKQEELDAERVIIECSDKQIIIEQPSVQKITMQGQESWQISGVAQEEATEERIRDEDVVMVAEKSGKSKEEALEALKRHEGDIAQAILELK